MADLAAIAGLMATVRNLKDLVASMVHARDTAVLRAKVGEFNERLIDAQQDIFAIQQDRAALVERVTELVGQIAKLEAWQTEKERYELKDLTGGRVFAYALKEAMTGGEPAHPICAHCYQAGSKSILQRVRRSPYPADVLTCPACHNDLYLSGTSRPEHFGKSPFR
jgi:hypothetical protein